MKLSLLSLSLLPLSLALPTSSSNTSPDNVHLHLHKRSEDAFSVLSSRSASPIHLLPMNAANTSFYLGEKPSTHCPSTVAQVAPCPRGEGTAFVGSGGSLDVSVPGGQQVYVDSSGALRFTVPHSASIGPGASTGPFEYYPGNPIGHYLYEGQGASGFMACPVQQGQQTARKWQVFAALLNATVPEGDVADCLGFSAMAVQARQNETAAWEYI